MKYFYWMTIALALAPVYADRFVVFEESTMEVAVPESSLGEGSVIVTSKFSANFLEWSRTNKEETYDLTQRVLRVWESRGIQDCFVYGKVSEGCHFSWEIVPFPYMRFPFLKQLSVLWRVAFGGTFLSAEDRQKISNSLIVEQLSLPQERVLTEHLESDAFCNRDVIQKQLVLEGEFIYVLYNYAPINTGEQLHFLLVPKRHCQHLENLTKGEYVELLSLSQRLVAFYQGQGQLTAHLFNKNGKPAGQTVPHFHQHIVFTATETQDRWGQLAVLKNMLFGSSPLSEEELATRVATLRETLAQI